MSYATLVKLPGGGALRGLLPVDKKDDPVPQL